MNLTIGSFPIGPNGEYGSVSIAFVNGQLVSSVTLSPAAVLNEAAKLIPGGSAIPGQVATFLENAIGLK